MAEDMMQMVVDKLGDMQGDIGEIKGTVAAIDTRLKSGSETMDEHDERLRGVESNQDKVKGAMRILAWLVALLTTTIGVIGAAVLKKMPF